MAAKLEALSAGLLKSRSRELSIELQRAFLLGAVDVRRAALGVRCVATFAPASA